MGAELFNDTIEAGATWRLEVLDTSPPDDEPTDLSGCTARLQLRRSPDAADIELELTSTPAAGIQIEGVAGRITITMTAAQTAGLSGIYVYAMEVEHSNGDVDRLIEGVLKVSPEIVRS